MRCPLYLFSLLAITTVSLHAQTTLADDLGYPPGTRLVILHADDLGMSHSVNEASFRALTEGSVSSASIMVPTPWVPEVAAFAKTHPALDLGLHLTLTSEWTNYRWGPMARSGVNSLLDKDHYLYGSCEDFQITATVEEVERELRAQVEQALRLGFRPTHLDSHMGCLFWTKPEFFAAYLQLGRDYDLPVLVDRHQVRASPDSLQSYLRPGDMAVDYILGAPEEAQGGFAEAYNGMLRTLKPGVSVLLLHCGNNNNELQAAVAPQIPYGAAWRQEDFDYFSSPELAALLKAEKIELITYRELYKKWKARAANN